MKIGGRVAVASRSFSRHAALRAALEAQCESVTFNDAGVSLAGPDLIAFLRGHDKAITALERLDAAVFDALPELRIVSKFGVGLDMVDLAAMERAGVRLGWTAGVNRRSVAELVIAAAIQLLHRVPESQHDIAHGRWRQIVGRQLSGRTLGVIGSGHIGKEVARLAAMLGCRVLLNDIVDVSAFARDLGAEVVDVDALLSQSDVVTLHVPLDDSTRALINDGRLAAMKAGAVLINMSRGGVVDESALASRLRAGHLAGAALDVFEIEPPATRELVELTNVIATSHIGGSTEEAILAMGQAAIAGLASARLPRECGLL